MWSPRFPTFCSRTKFSEYLHSDQYNSFPYIFFLAMKEFVVVKATLIPIRLCWRSALYRGRKKYARTEWHFAILNPSTS